MSDTFHGFPCWYELSTPNAQTAAAFYADLLGWQMGQADMGDFIYHIAAVDGVMVAGMSEFLPDGVPPNWLVYFAVDNADTTAAAVAADGGRVHAPPADIPGTGRFAILADPQGAVFGILQPLPDGSGGAFDQMKSGHGNWHELMTTDPVAALDFYGRHFGWVQASAMDMGPMGSYHIFARGAQQLGGMMRLPAPGVPPAWLPYFGVEGIDAACARLTAAGGAVQNGPHQVPGGAWAAQVTDPQGAWLALVGPK